MILPPFLSPSPLPQDFNNNKVDLHSFPLNKHLPPIPTHHFLRHPSYETRYICWSPLERGGDGKLVRPCGGGEGFETAAGYC